MEWLRKSKKLLLGGLTGSFVTFFGPVAPPMLTGQYFTMEELAWQKPEPVEAVNSPVWAFQWVNSRGYVLKKVENNGRTDRTALKRAVYRILIDN